MTKAVYAGSFDPFTLGHLDIVEQAVPLFDEVTILICDNSSKTRMTDAFKMSIMIEECCKKYPNVTVDVTKGLVGDYCGLYCYEYLIRGLRNTSDYLYEENIAKINHEVNSDLKTIYFRSQNEAISSSMVKELWKYEKDVDKYLPRGVSI